MRRLLIALILIAGVSGVSGSPLSDTVGAQSTTNPFSATIFHQGAEVTYFNPALLTSMEALITFNVFYVYQNLYIHYGERTPTMDIVGALGKDQYGNTTYSGIYAARRVVGKRQGGGIIDKPLAYRPLPSYNAATPNKLQQTPERGSLTPDEGMLYAAIGGILPLIKNYLALGVYANMPAGSLQGQQSRFADERESSFSNSLYFELYGDRMKSNNVTLALAGGYKWIHAGAGVKVVTNATVNTLIYTPDPTKPENKIEANSNIGTSVAPYFGLYAKPWWKLELAATIHLPVINDIGSENVIKFWEMNDQTSDRISTNIIDVAYAYQPLKASFAVALVDLEAGDLTVDVNATLNYSRWSQYKNRYNQRPQDNVIWDDRYLGWGGTSEVDSLTMGAWISQTTPSMAWSDTVDGSIGVAMEILRNKIGLDLAYYQTPVPDQPGRTNYIDNSKIMIGLGYSYTWKLGNFELELGAGAEAQFLIPRTTTKTEGIARTAAMEEGMWEEGYTPNGDDNGVIDEFPESVDYVTGALLPESEGFQTNNPGYPGYSNGGQLFSGSMWLTLYWGGALKD